MLFHYYVKRIAGMGGVVLAEGAVLEDGWLHGQTLLVRTPLLPCASFHLIRRPNQNYYAITNSPLYLLTCGSKNEQTVRRSSPGRPFCPERVRVRVRE